MKKARKSHSKNATPRSTRKVAHQTKMPSLKFFTLLGVFSSAVLCIIAAAVTITAPPTYAVTPPDSCFAFNAGSGTITNYYNNEGNNGANPACPRAVDIPSTIGGVTVTAISANALNVKQLTSLTIPSSVITLGNLTYNNLTSLTIPNTVTSQPDLTANKLSSLVLQSHLTTIDGYKYPYNSLARLTIPAGVTTIEPDAFFGQSSLGNTIRQSGNPSTYIFSTDPVVVQNVYDMIWYTKAYTVNPANPNNLTDAAVSEYWEIGDGNDNGNDKESIGGHIINPAAAVIRYEDSEGNDIASEVTVTGIKTGETPSSALDSSDYLHTYLITESAIQAPEDPYSPTGGEQTTMDTGFAQYYRLGDEVTFTPKSISGYLTPSAQNVTLDEEENIITFAYAAEIKSVPFSGKSVVGGVLTDTTPPEGADVPLITQSILSIDSTDCTTIQSANLVTPASIITSTPPSNVELLGGMDFSLVCSNGGASAVSYALGGQVEDTSKLRVYKYNSTTETLTDITSLVTLSSEVIDDETKTVITYSLVDGSELDEDGAVNGIIEDPVVIGYTGDTSELPTLADTGANLILIAVLAALAIIVGGGTAINKTKPQPKPKAKKKTKSKAKKK